MEVLAVMDTTAKGYLAILKVEERAQEKGIIVSRPVVDAAYDLVLDDGRKLHRVQVKYADGKPAHGDGAIVVSLGRRIGKGFRHALYSRKEIEAVLVFVPKIQQVLWISPIIFEKKRTLYLRFEGAKNGQIKGLNLASAMVW